jgi:hypothetical protein
MRAEVFSAGKAHTTHPKGVISLTNKHYIITRPGREARTAPITNIDRLLLSFREGGSLRAASPHRLAQRLVTLYGAKLGLSQCHVRAAVDKWLENGTVVRTPSGSSSTYKVA